MLQKDVGINIILIISTETKGENVEIPTFRIGIKIQLRITYDYEERIPVIYPTFAFRIR